MALIKIFIINNVRVAIIRVYYVMDNIIINVMSVNLVIFYIELIV